MSDFSKKGEIRTKGEEKMRRKWKRGEMRKEKKERIKQKEGKTWRKRKKLDAEGFVFIFRERTSSFSLGSWKIRPSDSFETRREVVLHREDNA